MFGDRPTAASSAQDVAGKSWEIDTPSYHNIPVDKTTIFVYLGKFFISPDQHFAEGTKHHVLLPPPRFQPWKMVMIRPECHRLLKNIDLNPESKQRGNLFFEQTACGLNARSDV